VRDSSAGSAGISPTRFVARTRLGSGR